MLMSLVILYANPKYNMHMVAIEEIFSGNRIVCMDLNKIAGKECSGDSD